MIDGLYAGASGMLAQRQHLDAIASNIANVNTDGYRSQRTGFVALGRQAAPGGAPVGSGVAAVDLGPDPAQGPLEQTGDPFDLAIAGGGYFQVRRPNGQLALTRAGSFQLNSSGQLVTASGDALVPPLQLPAGIDPGVVTVASNGAVAANGRPAGQINVVAVPAPGGLLANGDGTYSPTAASGPVRPATGASIAQGFVEGSNTDLIDSMVGMIVGQRSFEAAAATVRTEDETFAALLGIIR